MAKLTKVKEIVEPIENTKEVEAPTMPSVLTLQDVKNKGQEFIDLLNIYAAQQLKAKKSADRFNHAKRQVSILLNNTIIE